MNKATTLERLCERLGLASTHAVAVGDSMNDHEMLVWAGFGVAMGQAVSATLALADAVTTAIPGDGVAEVLKAMEITSLRVTSLASRSSRDVMPDPGSA